MAKQDDLLMRLCMKRSAFRELLLLTECRKKSLGSNGKEGNGSLKVSEFESYRKWELLLYEAKG